LLVVVVVVFFGGGPGSERFGGFRFQLSAHAWIFGLWFQHSRFPVASLFHSPVSFPALGLHAVVSGVSPAFFFFFCFFSKFIFSLHVPVLE